MLNRHTFTSLAFLAQVAFLGANAQTQSSQLLDIVPKREVLYVGGRYTNSSTASLSLCYLVVQLLIVNNRIIRPSHHQQLW